LTGARWATAVVDETVSTRLDRMTFILAALH